MAEGYFFEPSSDAFKIGDVEGYSSMTLTVAIAAKRLYGKTSKMGGMKFYRKSLWYLISSLRFVFLVK